MAQISAPYTQANSTIMTHPDQSWYMDSDSSAHITYDLTLFSNFHEIHNFTITMADGSKIETIGIGSIDLNLLINNKKTLVELRKIYYLPKLSYNLISLSTLEKRSLTWSGTNKRLEIRDRNELII